MMPSDPNPHGRYAHRGRLAVTDKAPAGVAILPLTPAERRTMVGLCAFIQAHHRVPSIRELAMSLDRFFVGVSVHLTALARKGYICRPVRGGRAISIRFAVVEEAAR